MARGAGTRMCDISVDVSAQTVMSTEQTTQELLLQWAMSALTEVMENQLEAQSNMIRELLLQSEQPKNSW
ncbi:hypothetical protein INT48_005333 [Thamnidium elegans]|uniref:Uncharacterized protein n=1 Tax=Thamnidium elegans TaxID=101142 RepID=A0A8H7SFI6_9FUNG|nr:hypothetical protein INT48_005333 [Thamnidium elegans]